VKKKWLKTERLSSFWNLVAGAEAGIVMALVTNPVWVVKTRMQLQLMNPKGKFYRGFIDGVRSTYREEGVKGLYRGIGPAVLLVSHGALQFMAYEELKRWARQWHGTVHLTGVEYFVIGSLSKLFASFTTYPFSLIKTRFQADPHFFWISYRGILRSLVKVVRMEGLRGLYRGFFINALRVVPYSAATLAVYEQILKVLSRLATTP
jgi:solute carrier family 25 folate transporter 32